MGHYWLLRLGGSQRGVYQKGMRFGENVNKGNSLVEHQTSSFVIPCSALDIQKNIIDFAGQIRNPNLETLNKSETLSSKRGLLKRSHAKAQRREAGMIVESAFAAAPNFIIRYCLFGVGYSRGPYCFYRGLSNVEQGSPNIGGGRAGQPV